MYKAEEQGCDVLKPREEEVDVIDGVDLLYKGRQVLHERGWVVIVEDVEIDAVLAAGEEGLPVLAAEVGRGVSFSSEPEVKRRNYTHAVISRRTPARTRGRGKMVSRLPRGI